MYIQTKTDSTSPAPCGDTSPHPRLLPNTVTQNATIRRKRPAFKTIRTRATNEPKIVRAGLDSPSVIIFVSPSPDKTVIQIVCVNPPARNTAFQVVGRRPSASRLAGCSVRSIERCEFSVSRAFEPVVYVTCVSVLPGDRTNQIDTKRIRTLAGHPQVEYVERCCQTGEQDFYVLVSLCCRKS